MSFFYSNVPLVDKEKCPLAAHHNLIAKEFNKRLSGAGPACAWGIFYYADGIFTGMRNTATPGQPLGVNPPEDEWWKVYAHIDLSTAQTGEGNWPLTLAGNPEGASVMNPLNAYIFGRVTSENKVVDKMGPWAEGNLFDGLVETSRAVLSNKTYWSDAFRQRGAYKANKDYSLSKASSWRKGQVSGVRNVKYLPGPKDPVWFSKGLFWVGRSSDHFFPEYASNTIYMRYPPAVTGGVFTKFGVPHYPNQGVLKRKNAAKDLLRWVLWVFTYYFRGSEHQRSLFCERKTWDAPVIEFSATTPYIGQQTFGMKRTTTNGPLNVCKVGFDVFSYMTRQNVLAPCLAGKVHKTSNPERRFSTSDGRPPATDGMGYAKMDQIRPKLKFEIKHGTKNDNFLGSVNGKAIPGVNRDLSATSGKSSANSSDTTKVICYENYDDFNQIGMLTGGKMYGKAIRVIGDYEDDSFNKTMLFNLNPNTIPSASRTGENDYLPLRNLEPSSRARGVAKHCMAGYYIETSAVDNPNMVFKVKVWGGSKVIHETVIWKKYSYTVNRVYDSKAYIFNKIFYFKNPISDYEKIRFEIVPVLDDKFVDINNKTSAKDNYDSRISDMRTKHKNRPDKHHDKVISFGNPWSNITQIQVSSSTLLWHISNENKPSRVGLPNKTYIDRRGTASKKEVRILIPKTVFASLGLQDGSPVSFWMGVENNEGGFRATAGGYVLGGSPFFVRLGRWHTGVEEVDESDPDARREIFLYKRRDSSVSGGGDPVSLLSQPLQNRQQVEEWINEEPDNKVRKIVIQKLTLDENMFSATVEPLIVLKQRPSFQDLYSLLRVTSAQSNHIRNSMSRIVGLDGDVGTVGHDFFDSNRIWKNYLKYGSAQNIYGSDVVPVLRQKVSCSPLYESARKFVSSHMRMTDRHDLVDYRIEGGKGVLYFKRFNKYLPKKAKATVLKHMEPSIEPVGRFHKGTKGNLNDLPNDNYKPIMKGRAYFVYGSGIKYMGNTLAAGSVIVGGNQSYIDNAEDALNSTIGLYEMDGIVSSSDGSRFPTDPKKNYQQSIEKKTVEEPYSSFPYKSNEWIMFMNSVHYSSSLSSIYKPSVYGDVMGFLNNRCHHRSLEYERSTSIKYDMIRQELLRVPMGPRNTPGTRLQVFLSKSPPNLNYVFNTNDPEHRGIISDGYGGVEYKQSNLEDYGILGAIRKYRKSCPAVSRKPYKVKSCTLVDNFGRALGSSPMANPSSIRNRGASKLLTPINMVRVELDRPLDKISKTRLVGSGGWSSVSKDALEKQHYRTDENAVIEYLMHKYLGRSGYNCKRMMIGDYGTSTNIHEGIGYRPFGACFPRFYFLKLIPLVGIDSPLESDPYSQLDFYMRASAGQFVMPYNYYNAIGQVDSINWQFSELASRSSEEDPTAYYYVDPREISNN